LERKFALVTGATGFVGRHLCNGLRQAGVDVRGVYRKQEPHAGWPKEIEWVKIPRLGLDTDWSSALSGGITHVIHLAAIAHRISPREQVSEATYDRVNHLATLQLVREVIKAGSAKRFFFLSSIGVTATLADEPVDEQTPCCPESAYARSKLAAERGVQQLLAESPVEWCIFRAPLLYGPGNPGNMERLLKLVKLSIPLPLGSIRNRRTFLYIGNLIDAILVALEHPGAARKTFCIADDQQLSTSELLRELARVSKRSVHLFPCPIFCLRALASVVDILRELTGLSVGLDRGSVEKLCGSLVVTDSLFRNTCGWKPPYTVQEGLRATLAEVA